MLRLHPVILIEPQCRNRHAPLAYQLGRLKLCLCEIQVPPRSVAEIGRFNAYHVVAQWVCANRRRNYSKTIIVTSMLVMLDARISSSMYFGNL